MGNESYFKADLAKEQRLAPLLDEYYKKHLVHYSFKRITNLKEQFLGIDVVFTHKTTGQEYSIDEKAQLDYINEDLPTFAFELAYYKNNVQKEGWFYDQNKKTAFYALVTAIYDDRDQFFSSCKITLVNRKKLQFVLNQKGIGATTFKNQYAKGGHGKICVECLNDRKEGYLFLSAKNKIEKPLNLILRLNWLLEVGVAKRLA